MSDLTLEEEFDLSAAQVDWDALFPEEPEKPKPLGYFRQLGAEAERGGYQFGTAVSVVAALGGFDTFDDIASGVKSMREIPYSEAMQEFHSGNWLGATLKAPHRILPELAIQAGTSSLPAQVAGGVVGFATGGPGGAVAAASGSSFALEHTMALLETLESEYGVDTGDAAALRAAFANPDIINPAKLTASKKAAPIAIGDALSMSVAGKFLGPATKALSRAGIPQAAAQVGAFAGEMGVQAGFDIAGETTGQLWSTGEVVPSEVAAEVLGGAGQQTAEIFGMPLARGEQALETETAAPEEAPVAEFTPEVEAALQQIEDTLAAEEVEAAPVEVDTQNLSNQAIDMAKAYGVDIVVGEHAIGGESTGGRIVVGKDVTPIKAFAANWLGGADFTSTREYPQNQTAAAHEIAHALFSRNPQKGHEALNGLLGLGVKNDVAFESLIDLGGLYLLEPRSIIDPLQRTLVSQWLDPHISGALGPTKPETAPVEAAPEEEIAPLPERGRAPVLEPGIGRQLPRPEITQEEVAEDVTEAEAERAEIAPPEAVVGEEEVEAAPTAEFVGMQETPSGPPIPLFNIRGGERDGSTVAAQTLEELGIAVPEVPAETAPDTPAAVAEEIVKAAAEDRRLTTEEEFDVVLKQIDEAVAGLIALEPTGEPVDKARHTSALAGLEALTGSKDRPTDIVFRIPGDGIFTIMADYDALRSFKTRLEKHRKLWTKKAPKQKRLKKKLGRTTYEIVRGFAKSQGRIAETRTVSDELEAYWGPLKGMKRPELVRFAKYLNLPPSGKNEAIRTRIRDSKRGAALIPFADQVEALLEKATAVVESGATAIKEFSARIVEVAREVLAKGRELTTEAIQALYEIVTAPFAERGVAGRRLRRGAVGVPGPQAGTDTMPTASEVKKSGGLFVRAGKASDRINQQGREALQEYLGPMRRFIEQSAARAPQPVRRAVRRMTMAEFSEFPVVRALHEAYKNERVKSRGEREALIRTTLRATDGPLERTVADRLFRGHPLDIENIPQTVLDALNVTRQQVRDIAQRMTQDLQAMGLPFREEWLDAGKHWYPNLFAQHELKSLGGQIFAGISGKRIGLSAREKKAATTPRITDRWTVRNRRTGKVEEIFNNEEAAQAWLSQQTGRYRVKYMARDESGKMKHVVEGFKTIKERNAFINSFKEEGSVRVDPEMKVLATETLDKLVLVSPRSPEELRSMGLVEDFVTNINKGFGRAQDIIAKVRFFDKVAEHIMADDVDWFRTTEELKKNPDPDFVRVRDLGLRIPEEIDNETIQRMLQGAVHRDIGDTLAGVFGARRGKLGLLWGMSDLSKSIDRHWKPWVTVRYPPRYVKQIVENEVTLFFADASISLNAKGRVKWSKEFLAWVQNKENVSKAMNEFAESGLLETDFLHSDEMRHLVKSFESFEDLNEMRHTIFDKMSTSETGLKIRGAEAQLQTLYHLEDAIYKYQLYAGLRERGHSAEKALQQVKDFMFDWTNAPPIVRFFQFIPFLPSVAWQFTRIIGNKMIQAPVTTSLKIPLMWLAFMLIRKWRDEKEGITAEDRKAPPGDWPKVRPTQIVLPLTDSQGRNLAFDARSFIPFADLGVPQTWGEIRQAKRRAIPMFLQGPTTLINQRNRWGRDLAYTGTKDPEKLAEQTRRVWFEAASDTAPGLLFSYWAGLYKNAQREPGKRQPWWAQAVTGPGLGVRSVIDWDKSGAGGTRPSPRPRPAPRPTPGRR